MLLSNFETNGLPYTAQYTSNNNYIECNFFKQVLQQLSSLIPLRIQPIALKSFAVPLFIDYHGKLYMYLIFLPYLTAIFTAFASMTIFCGWSKYLKFLQVTWTYVLISSMPFMYSGELRFPPEYLKLHSPWCRSSSASSCEQYK